MKTKKQVFYLQPLQVDPYLVEVSLPVENYDPSDHLIIWTIRMYDHVLIMPELTLLVQDFYCFN